MPSLPRYTKAIGRSLSNLASTISDDRESYNVLLSNSEFILCPGFGIPKEETIIIIDYDRDRHQVYMRSVLLKLWSRLLIMLKTARFADQCDIFKYISAITTRREFFLEHCGFQGAHIPLDAKTSEQLGQYLFLLKLSLLYTPRAVVANVSASRDFVFTTVTIAILRIPEYRVCFLTKLQGLIKNTVIAEDVGLEEMSQSASTPSFLDKYIDPSLCRDIPHVPSCHPTDPVNHSGENTTVPSRVADNVNSSLSLPHTQSETSEMLYPIEEDLPSTRSDLSVEERDLDIQAIAATIPPVYVIRSDQTVFHDEVDHTPTPISEEEFCYDDHNFAIVSIDDDHFENPYSTTNIQDILRNHRYTLNPTQEISGNMTMNLEENVLPPLKLPNMNVFVDMMIEQARSSKEIALKRKSFMMTHPSLFAWESVLDSQYDGFDGVEETQLNDAASDGSLEKERGCELIGDLYLDMQIVDVMSKSKALVAQFITTYMNHIRYVCDGDPNVCWEAIPGFFLFMRLFLINFQDFFVSKLSSGILRMNLTVDRVMRDSVAYSMCDVMVINGDVLNYVMSILFDKCNVSVFLDISKSMMVLHNLLKAVRQYNDHILYHQYSLEFYRSVYSSPEVKLLLLLQSSNKQSFITSQFISTPIGTCSIHSSQQSTEASCDLDLPQFDALSHTNHYYNNSLSIIYTQYNALDLMYETTIDSTIRKKEELSHSEERTLPSQWVTPSLKRVTSLMEESSSEIKSSSHLLSAKSASSLPAEPKSTSSLPSDTKSASPLPAESKSTPVVTPSPSGSNSSVPNEYNSIRNANYFVNRNVEGFTLPQAIQFLLEKNIITSRGEGLDFLTILQDRRMIVPVKYDRRFRTTIFRIVPLAEMHLFAYPEVSRYNHMLFESRINYIYFLYVLQGLIRMPHIQILEKVITFIYFNEDFFNGEHRLMLYKLIVFPNFSLFFTHWNANIRHIFHRLLLYKMFRTRLSYLPGYGSHELQNDLYNKLLEHKKKQRREGIKVDTQSIPSREEEDDIYKYDFENQNKLWKEFDYDAYSKSITSKVVKAKNARIATSLTLSEVRETQWVDLRLAEMMKAKLHILIGLNEHGNNNSRNGLHFIPSNQLRYYWVSMLEFATLLTEYERKDAKLKANAIRAENVYHDGIGMVDNTDIPWSTVNEMETRVVDDNVDIEFFLAYKQ